MAGRRFARVLIAALLVSGASPPAALLSRPPAAPAAARPSAAAAPGTVVLQCCPSVSAPGTTIGINTGSGPGAVTYRFSGPRGVRSTLYTVTGPLIAVWTASLPPAQWIHPTSSSGLARFPRGDYRYVLMLVVPNCTVPMRVEVQGQAAADDAVTVRLDNQVVGSTPLVQIASPPPVASTVPGWGYRTERIASFTRQLAPGSHQLRFDVNNVQTFHGLLVRGRVSTGCH
jgi:hypothetical protein